MRKLIVLLMTSVLATGAVAQADTVNVTEDPKDFINILQITDANGDPVDTLVPSIDGARTYYQLEAEIFNPLNGSDRLAEYLAFCLYDTAAVDQSTTVEDLCGYGAEDADPTLSSAKGTNNPKAALQLSVDPVVAADRFSMDFTNANVFGEGEGEGAAMASPTQTFRGDVINPSASPFDNVINARLPIALSHAAAESTAGWKVRVVLYTSLGTRLELTDDLNSYSIGRFMSLDTDRDTTVDYGDVIPGDSFTKENITTGTYRSNHPVDIRISATEFASGGTSVGFTTGAPAAGENKFGLDCTHGGSGGLWLSTTAQDFMTDEVASNTQPQIEDAKALPTHSCELKVGEGVAIGSYSNAVTVDIADAS